MTDAPPAPKRPAWQTWALRAARGAMLAAVLYFVGGALVRQIAALSWDELHVRWSYVALGAAGLVVARALIVFTYRPLLEPYCGWQAWWRIAPVAWIPALGRYVPGKVVSFVWTVSMLRGRGMQAPAAVVVTYLVTGLGILVGLTAAVPLTLWGPVRRALPMAWAWCAALAAAGVVCLHPAVLRVAANAVWRRLRRQGRLALPRPARYLSSLAALAGQIAFMGLALWCVSRAFVDISPRWIPLLAAASGLAASAGLLAFFAPAGIGVREGILLLILGAVIDEPGAAAVATVVLRLVDTLVEMVLAGAALLVLRRAGRLAR